MRRQSLPWVYMVSAILLSVYGLFFVVREHDKNQKVFISAIVALSIGLSMLLLYMILYFVFKHKKVKTVDTKIEVKEKIKEPLVEIKVEPQAKVQVERKEEPKVKSIKVNRSSTNRSTLSRGYSSDFSESGYVKLVGHGPILEVRGNVIRDMRNNTYYTIEANAVSEQGRGYIYRLERNRIITMSGTPLYEMYGGNINKVFGGFFASVSGNYITKYDLSTKLELTNTFSSRVILLIAALVF